MKVYVDGELPKSCKDCFFCEHIEENIDGKGRDEVACYFEGCLNNIILGDTFSAKTCKHLQSLSDHDKQVRKEVVGDLKEELKKNGKCSIRVNGTMDFFIELNKLNEILDQNSNNRENLGS